MKKLLPIFIVALLATPVYADDFSAWSNYKVITIDNTNVDSDLTNFPVLIDVTADSDIGATAQADCDDIRFVANDGTTLLSHDEIECAESGGSITAWYRVEVPTVASAATTDIRIYYGNGVASDAEDEENVYDATTEGVYHLTETSATTTDHYKDSGPDNNHGTAPSSRNPAQQTSGCFFSTCADFSDDWIIPASNLDMANWTIFAMAYLDDLDGAQHIIGNDVGGYSDDVFIGMMAESASYVTNDHWGIVIQEASNSGRVHPESSGVASTATWTAVVGVSTSSTIGVWVDGTEEEEVSCHSDCDWGNNAIAIGTSSTTSSPTTRDWDGRLNSLIIWSENKSDAWVKFLSYNATEADNEISFGAEEANAITTSTLGGMTLQGATIN